MATVLRSTFLILRVSTAIAATGKG